jgi:glutaminyl-tRNA synthetase
MLALAFGATIGAAKEPATVSAPLDASRVPSDDARSVPRNFITDVIDADLREGRVRRVVTRFPPEPNGYLHVGHAKAIALSFGIARDYGGRAHLRMDDTNPTTEDPAFVRAIQEDMLWLGFEWDELRYASDYFDELYALARRLVEMGLAYVDSQPEEAVRATRGTVTEAGVPSPYRDRSPEESLDLFTRMRAGAFEDGAHVLRAKIDMASPNMLLRDPVLYRIKHAHHYRTGDAWPIYPLYDFAHPLSDAIEGITHSLCSLEFENNRAVYDWLVAALFPEPRPRQYEFARLALDHTVLSKRRLIALVDGEYVTGWDDPRMPTIAALRRRGVPPAAVRTFVTRVGVTKTNARTDPALLENTVREALDQAAPRALAVLDPLPVDLDGLPRDLSAVTAPRFPDDPARSDTRRVPISDRIVIERDDFALDPPPGFKRLAPGRSVRLRHAFVITCTGVVRGAGGSVERITARIEPDSLGRTPEGVTVRGAVHWVDAAAGLPAEFRLYDRLFAVPDPGSAGGAFTDHLDPASCIVRHGLVEPSVRDDPLETRYQFERLGYFWRDPVDGRQERLVMNRIASLKDGWSRAERASAGTARRGARAERDAETPAGDDVDPIERLEDDARLAAETLVREHGLPRADAALIAATPAFGRLLTGAIAAGAPPTAAASWIANDVRRVVKASGGAIPKGVTGQAVAELVAMVEDGALSTGLARDVFDAVVATGEAPRVVVASRGVQVVSDEDALRAHVEAAVRDHPREVAAYRAGKHGLAGFFVGQVMRATGGQADPVTLQRLVREALGADDGS